MGKRGASREREKRERWVGDELHGDREPFPLLGGETVDSGETNRASLSLSSSISSITSSTNI